MSRRLLIVDNSIPMRRMIGKALACCGWEVVGEANDGEEAVAKYKEVRPDAVTMDIMMPKSDGICALQRIVEFDPGARIVIVSALNQASRISEAMSAGARDFIAKPFMPRQLRYTMAKCLEGMVETEQTVQTI